MAAVAAQMENRLTLDLMLVAEAASAGGCMSKLLVSKRHKIGQ